MPSKKAVAPKGTIPHDLSGYVKYRDGDDTYKQVVDDMTRWLGTLPYGTKILYDGIEYHKPEYRFNFWYEKGYTIGCPTEHTVFPSWFAKAAEGDQSKVTVKSVPKIKPKADPVPDNGVPEVSDLPGGVESRVETDQAP